MAFSLQFCHAHVVVQYSPDGGHVSIRIPRFVPVYLSWLTTPGESNSGLEFPPTVHNLPNCGFGPNSLKTAL